MNEVPLISICIPAFKRLDYLRRLLDSIKIQTYKNYEIIITDDSADETVKKFVDNYKDVTCIKYYKNDHPLGTPENWNESIRKAAGKWIKLMHDDDWFTNENSLQVFVDAILKSGGCPFIFCAHNDVDESSHKTVSVHLDFVGKFLLRQSPLNLMKKQYIGAPSNTLIKRDMPLFYDNKFKWVVDFEYYIRCLWKTKCFYYINETLVNIGINNEQVTRYSFRKPEVEIPENHMMVEKLGYTILKNIFVYDHYWRLYRNMGIRSKFEVQKYYDKPLHSLLKQMINFQRRIPGWILRVGVFSKLNMLISYFFSLFTKI